MYRLGVLIRFDLIHESMSHWSQGARQPSVGLLLASTRQGQLLKRYLNGSRVLCPEV